MSSTPFGEHLRREREMRGVSLDEIAAATRISTRFLEALETEKWDQLPGGAFNRGFIRSIARFLGIDEDGLVAEYTYGRDGANGHARPAVHSQQIPRNYRPAIVTAAFAVLLLVGGVWGLQHYGSRIAARIHGRLGAGAASNSRAEDPQPANSSSARTAPVTATPASSATAPADSTTARAVAPAAEPSH
jgi:cytoskeleton protein RodZ